MLWSKISSFDFTRLLDIMNHMKTKKNCELIVIYSTYSSEESAHKMASLLLEIKLVACANIMPGGSHSFMEEGF